MTHHREKPTRRRNPSGAVVWCARWTPKTGPRKFGLPPAIPGTYAKRGPCKTPATDGTCCAQHAIDKCYELDAKGPERPDTVGGYAATWTKHHPRANVTDRTNMHRINALLDVKVEGAPFRDWPMETVRRRHVNALTDHMLRVQGRAYTGVNNILASLSAMWEDAVEDEVTVANPLKGAKRVRANDPRIQKTRRAVRVFSWEQMHEFARACAAATTRGPELREWRRVYAEPMVRVLSDCGLRAGELFALERGDLDLREGTLRVERTVSLGEVLQGTKTDHGEVGAGRTVPVPAGLCGMLEAMPKRIDTRLLFPSPTGLVWWYHGWWRDVWVPGRAVAGMDVRPHEMRHSYVSLLRAARVDPADLARVAGHSVQTADARYTHALGRSHDVIRLAVGRV